MNRIDRINRPSKLIIPPDIAREIKQLAKGDRRAESTAYRLLLHIGLTALRRINEPGGRIIFESLDGSKQEVLFDSSNPSNLPT